ncbi:MAG: rhodanese-like domain-containing protein, partial [Actinomycetota bacterium]|nr:rhodanese-like domain-containing protein [Actinomycetota bacterium]
MTYQELVAAAKSQIREIQPEELEPRRSGVIVVDVREADEFDQGSIEGAIHLARGVLEGSIRSHVPDVEREVVLYCEGGARSALAALSLQQLGYTRVSSLAGGFGRWKTEGYPWGTPKGLTTDHRGRYSR